MIDQSPASPQWSRLTKQVVALTFIVILGALLVQFKTLIMPVIMAFVVAYLMHLPVLWISRKLRISWRAAVSIVYLVFVLLLIGLLTWGGLGLIQQITNLINTIQENIDELPAFIESLSGKVIAIGPFKLDLSDLEWGTVGQQVLGYVEPALGKLANLIGSLAGSAASTIGWLFFIILISYFFLLESGGLRNRIIQVEIPGYAEDVQRLGKALGATWNAYLRGQMIIVFTTFVVYSIVLTILGVRYSFGLALIAGLANFLPYVGPGITWTVLGLVTYFQDSTILGMTPFWYMLLVLGTSVLIDQVFNNLVVPRIMAKALKVHPAFVLISAIIAASLLGVVGVILAAPLLATLQLFGTYIYRKMFDRDPWLEKEGSPPPEEKPRLWRRFIAWWRSQRMKRIDRRTIKIEGETNDKE